MVGPSRCQTEIAASRVAGDCLVATGLIASTQTAAHHGPRTDAFAAPIRGPHAWPGRLSSTSQKLYIGSTQVPNSSLGCTTSQAPLQQAEGLSALQTDPVDKHIVAAAAFLGAETPASTTINADIDTIQILRVIIPPLQGIARFKRR